MTIGEYRFEVLPRRTRDGEYMYVVYRQGKEVERSKRSYPSEWDTFMRGWLAVNRLRAGG